MLNHIVGELFGIAITPFGFSSDLSGNSTRLLRFTSAKLSGLLLHFTNDVFQSTLDLIFVHLYFPSLKLADDVEAVQ